MAAVMRDLSKAECESLRRDVCPICNHRNGFVFGPEGGICVNVFCVHCDAGFNIAVAFGDIPWGELIREPKPGVS